MVMALMKTGLIQRIHKTTASDAMHSSAYAKVQQNHGGGPHSGMSFSARTKVDQKTAKENAREIVREFDDYAERQQNAGCDPCWRLGF